jgi:hypothetical protein
MLQDDAVTSAKIADNTIVNANINSSAAIAYSKLNLATSIANSDISSSAAIAYSKLNLATSIANSDISSSAAIAYSKLNLASSITTSDLATGITTTHGLGSASTPSITFTGDTNTGIFSPTADTIAFTEGGTEAMRINSSGNVGIGTSNPAGKLDVNGGSYLRGFLEVQGIEVGKAGLSGNRYAIIDLVGDEHYSDYGVRLARDNTGQNADTYLETKGTGAFRIKTLDAGPLIFFTQNSERMRITEAGDVCINTTGSSYGGLTNILFSGLTQVGLKLENTYNAYPTNNILFMNHTGVPCGSVSQTSSTSIAFNTSSDYRLKENVNYNFDATARLKQLKPARFNFIADANRTVDGFLAHEVSDIVPEAIVGTKDQTVTKEKVVLNVYGNIIAENIEKADWEAGKIPFKQADWEAGKIPNEEGKSLYSVDTTWEASKVVPVYQGIDQAKLTPLLTKALQETIEKIESLEARLTTLENKKWPT